MSVTKIPSATSKAVSTLVVTQAIELLDRSGVVERLEQWSPKRRVILNSRAMLAIWLVLAMESRPLTRRRRFIFCRTECPRKPRQRSASPRPFA